MSVHGDLNNDGNVDAADLALLRQLVSNKALLAQLSPEERAMLDMNNDGSVNYDDVIRLIQAIQQSAPADPEVGRCISSLRQKMGQR